MDHFLKFLVKLISFPGEFGSMEDVDHNRKYHEDNRREEREHTQKISAKRRNNSFVTKNFSCSASASSPSQYDRKGVLHL